MRFVIVRSSWTSFGVVFVVAIVSGALYLTVLCLARMVIIIYIYIYILVIAPFICMHMLLPRYACIL